MLEVTTALFKIKNLQDYNGNHLETSDLGPRLVIDYRIVTTKIVISTNYMNGKDRHFIFL